MAQNSRIKNTDIALSRKKKTNTRWKISKYFILWALFVFIGIKVKDIVLGWLTGNLIINPVFSFKEVHNTGAAFNLLQGRTDWLVIAGILCIVILTALVIFKPLKLTQQAVSAMALLSSGILLNTIERIQHGYVTDFIYFTFLDKFPVFNIADMMIVIGAVMLSGALLFKSRDNK